MIQGDTIFQLIRRAHTRLPEDVLAGIKAAHKKETEKTPQLQLKNILDNVKIAGEKGIPMCQDTGVPVFFAFGKELNLEEIRKTIEGAYSRAEAEIPLRPNMVDPITRDQISNGVKVYYEPAYSTEIHYLPKGAGSENVSRSRILLPHAGEEGIVGFVIETVRRAAGNPCPPIILGIGIGGTMDSSAYLAKKALLKRIDRSSPLEERITKEANDLGIGPMGLGGKTTCIGTNIETAPCHTASLPITVNVQCWANRHAGIRIGENVEYL